MAADRELIELRNIIKIFPPDVVAVDNVSVSFCEGEIHSIVGENGAGKSTLMKILYGSEKQNAGEIFIRGQKKDYKDPGEAIKDGIGMVHQEILLIPEYRVWENVVLGLEPVRQFGRLDEAGAREKVKTKISEFNFNLDADAQVSEISVAAQQKVEILKLLYRDVSILILDEPTSVLTPQEIPELFEELRALRDDGHTIIFISHHLDEVMELSDRITVLRKGERVATVDRKDVSKSELARMMVGREVFFTASRKTHRIGEIVLEVKNLNYSDARGRKLLSNVSFSVRQGEILGVAGVEGNGQYELVSCIIGLVEPTSGKMLIKGVPINDLPIIERRRRVAFVPLDRGTMGASVQASITENAIMTHHRINPLLTGWNPGILDIQAAKEFTRTIRDDFSVVMGDISSPFGSLSGGNQQKVILGRELKMGTDFILLDQPTRGLDVGSIEYVHEIILDLRRNDRAVLLISSDLEELFMLTDRILVMYRGKAAALLETERTSISEVGEFMLKGSAENEP